jgi:hypothetical protein
MVEEIPFASAWDRTPEEVRREGKLKLSVDGRILQQGTGEYNEVWIGLNWLGIDSSNMLL